MTSKYLNVELKASTIPTCLSLERDIMKSLEISFIANKTKSSDPVAHSDARPTGTQEVAGSILRIGNILLWRPVMKSFLRPFSPNR